MHIAQPQGNREAAAAMGRKIRNPHWLKSASSPSVGKWWPRGRIYRTFGHLIGGINASASCWRHTALAAWTFLSIRLLIRSIGPVQRPARETIISRHGSHEDGEEGGMRLAKIIRVRVKAKVADCMCFYIFHAHANNVRSGPIGGRNFMLGNCSGGGTCVWRNLARVWTWGQTAVNWLFEGVQTCHDWIKAKCNEF